MKHLPVLENEILEQFAYLSRIPAGVFFDGTLGAGGHAIAIAQFLKARKSKFLVIGVDRDRKALEISQSKVLQMGLEDNFVLIHDNFNSINQVLANQGIKKIDGALLDLGVSSMQFDDLDRGFSFKDLNQTLDMRMDQTQRLDAREILNTYSESDLTKLLKKYGEERFARQIARQIAETRKIKNIKLVGDLLSILEKSIPVRLRLGKIHYATKTFQALRIEVNSELNKLEQAIMDISDKLNPGGRLAIITFHSLEDRIVKRTFLKLQKPCTCPPKIPCVCGKKSIALVLTKKPIVPGSKELSINPRSRSAKLRIIEKV